MIATCYCRSIVCGFFITQHLLVVFTCTAFFFRAGCRHCFGICELELFDYDLCMPRVRLLGYASCVVPTYYSIDDFDLLFVFCPWSQCLGFDCVFALQLHFHPFKVLWFTNADVVVPMDICTNASVWVVNYTGCSFSLLKSNVGKLA